MIKKPKRFNVSLIQLDQRRFWMHKVGLVYWHHHTIPLRSANFLKKDIFLFLALILNMFEKLMVIQHKQKRL